MPETVLRLRYCLTAALLAPLLAGCTQWYYEFGEAIPAGYETRAEGLSLARVLAELGPPLRFLASEQGLVMAWESWRIRETSVGLTLGFVGVDALEFDWGDARVRGDYLLLLVNGQHRVSAAARVQRDNDLGGGAALQPFGGLVSVVDVQDLLRPLPQHRWGGSQLLRPPRALNNAARPGMGDSAIEQRGTPGGAGQRSLGWSDD
jgi:hypothetical protein